MPSNFKLDIPQKVNPDLQKERDSATFDVGKLTEILHGGPAAAKKRKEIGRMI